MDTLILLLLFIFAGVALMVVLGKKFAKPMAPEKLHKFTRWILPLVALSIIIQMFRYWM
jgi:cadmium resistance protein CadD (predicted permease)